MKGESVMDIGHRIFEIRKKEGLSQEQFAEMFHVTRQTVSNWENNKNYPDMNMLKDISDRFGVSFDYLLKEDDELMDRIDNTRKSAGIGKIIIALLAVIIVVTLLITAVPKVIDSAYYDPTRIAASVHDKERDFSTQQFTLDMKVYEELFIPGCHMDQINIVKSGIAKYNVEINPSMWWNDEKPEIVTGQIDHGKVLWNQPDSITPTVSNAFAWTSGVPMDLKDCARDIQKKRMEKLKKELSYEEGTVVSNLSAGRTSEEFRDYVDNLDPDKIYMAYVSFDRLMDYESAVSWSRKNDTGLSWAGIVTDPESQGGIIGMNTYYEGCYCYWDNDNYPDLLWYEDINGPDYDEKYEIVPDHEMASKRLVTMLRYMDEQKDFLQLMDRDGFSGAYESGLSEKADYIEKNGIQVYGFAGPANKEELLKMIGYDNVYSIYVDE